MKTSGREVSDTKIVEAIGIIKEVGKSSATLLQIKMNLRFAEASDIMDCIEKLGIVGPMVGAKPREIYLK